MGGDGVVLSLAWKALELGTRRKSVEVDLKGELSTGRTRSSRVPLNLPLVPSRPARGGRLY